MNLVMLRSYLKGSLNLSLEWLPLWNNTILFGEGALFMISSAWDSFEKLSFMP